MILGKTEQGDGSVMLLCLITLCMYLLVFRSDTNGSCLALFSLSYP